MAPLRLTVLFKNTASGRGLKAEHGLSLWIERGSRRVLFDAGQTDLLCRNADRLRVDLGTADALVLSHGHYDHTGGLSAALEGISRAGSDVSGRHNRRVGRRGIRKQ